MEKRFLKDVLVLIGILFVIFIICLFLPNRIPIHFNAKGIANMYANKYFLLFGAFIPYSIYWRFMRGRGNKKLK